MHVYTVDLTERAAAGGLDDRLREHQRRGVGDEGRGL